MEEQLNQDAQNLEDNLPLVNYIMLHRIYDLLSLIASEICEKEKVNKMIEYHNNGYLLGPEPSYSKENEE